MSDDLDVAALRSETPGCDDHIHLNNAGASLMPAPVVGAIHAHIDLEAQLGGYEAAAVREELIGEAYQSVAQLVGGRPDQIAFTESATIGYTQALSSIPFTVGDVIVTSRNDYVSNQIQLLSLQAKFGVRVIRAPDLPSGGVDPDAVRDLIRRKRPRVVCLTHVPTNSGTVQDVAAVGAICRSADVWFLVDGCQSVGQMDVKPEAMGCDFFSATFRKFLRGPRGAGFLYVSDRALQRGLEPLFIDLRGADWIAANEYRQVPGATRFETWEFAWALVLGAGAAAKYANRVGIPRIERRVRTLAQRVRSGLAILPGVRILDHGIELCGIVSAALGGTEAAHLASTLRSRGVFVSAQARPFALLDFEAKGVTSTVRISPHYYNTEAEIDRALELVARELSSFRGDVKA